MNSKIKTTEWLIVLFVTVLIDIFQAILTGFAIGLIINRILDVVILFVFNIYLWFRGVSLLDWKKIIAQLAAFIGEEIPFIGDLPLWSLDVIAIWIMVAGEKQVAKHIPMIKGAINTINKVKGVTQPRGQRPPPLNSAPGTRPPRLTPPPLPPNNPPTLPS